MKTSAASTLALLAALVPTTFAQTHTLCNPLNTTGCPPMQALGGNVTFNWNKTGIPSNEKVWLKTNRGKIDWVEKGATFTVERSGDAPTASSKFYMLFGRLEVVMKAASGKGIISSAILQSEALDEIDFEWKGSNSSILTNYFVCHSVVARHPQPGNQSNMVTIGQGRCLFVRPRPRLRSRLRPARWLPQLHHRLDKRAHPVVGRRQETPRAYPQ